jgi:hypothetical protein
MVAIAVGPVKLLSPPGAPKRSVSVGPVFRYVATHRQPGDTLYLYWGTDIAYRRYASRVGMLAGVTPIIGSAGGVIGSRTMKTLPDLRATNAYNPDRAQPVGSQDIGAGRDTHA